MTANVSIIIAQRAEALKIPNAALRFRPADSALVQTNASSAPVAVETGTNSGGQRQRGGGGGGGRRRGGPSNIHTVYLLSNDKADKSLHAVQIKTGISDGIFTEVVDGLKENDQVITSSNSSDTPTTASSNPFGGGGGFGRMR